MLFFCHPLSIRVFSYFYYLRSNCVLSVWCALVVILIMGHYTLKTRILAACYFYYSGSKYENHFFIFIYVLLKLCASPTFLFLLVSMSQCTSNKAFAVPTFKTPLKSMTCKLFELLFRYSVRGLLPQTPACHPNVGEWVTSVTNMT